MAGIRKESQLRKGKDIEISFEQLDEVVSYSRRYNFRPMILVNCISKSWIPECLNRLAPFNIHPLFLTPISRTVTPSASTVSFDFYGAFYGLCQYLQKSARERIALVGLNPSSSNDVIKKEAFLQFYQEMQDKGEQHIFWNYGDLEDCCNLFYQQIKKYNAVLCTNDVVAVKLIQFLKRYQISIPEDIYVAAMGNTFLSELISPKITIASFDCFSIGRHAVRVYNFLAKNPDIVSLWVNVSGQIIARQSTGSVTPAFLSISETPSSGQVDFYSDTDVDNILSLEELFRNFDDLDQHILHGLLLENPYSLMAESLYVSESTIKYRVSKMLKLARCQTKTQMMDLLNEYIFF